MLLHPTAPKPAWLWWDWWHLSHKHVTMGCAWSPTAWGLEELLEPLTAQFGVAASAMGCCLLMVTGPSVAAEEEQGWDQPLSGCQGVPGAAGAACTKALHTSTSWARAAAAPAPEGRWRGRGTHVALAWASSSPFPPGSWRHAWQRLAVSSTH